MPDASRRCANACVSKWCDAYSEDVVEKRFEYGGCVLELDELEEEEDDEEDGEGLEKTRAGNGCGGEGGAL